MSRGVGFEPPYVGCYGSHVNAVELYLDQGVAGEDVFAAQQQRIDGVGGGLGGLPILGLLLFEQPDAAILDRLLVAHDFVKGFDH